MEEKKKRCCCRKKAAEQVKAVEDYPGVAINKSDDNKVDSQLVKERTNTLNNNPRNSD